MRGRDVLADGGLVQLVAELGIRGGGWPQLDSSLGKAGPERPARTLTWHRSGPRMWLWWWLRLQRLTIVAVLHARSLPDARRR